MFDNLQRKVILEKNSDKEDGVYNLYTSIVLDKDDNVFKIITGKFTDKKAAYTKLAKRGYVVRKVLEKKVFDWIEKNAKSNIDAYAMFSTAISKWRNNNLLSDYYVKLLNDVPELNRERQKGNPNTKGEVQNSWDESVELDENIKDIYPYINLKEDLTDLHPYFLGKDKDYIPAAAVVNVYPTKFEVYIDDENHHRYRPVKVEEKPIKLETDAIYGRPLRFDAADGNKYYNPLFWDTLELLKLTDLSGYNGVKIEKEGQPDTAKFLTNNDIDVNYRDKGSFYGVVRQKGSWQKAASVLQNKLKTNENPEERKLLLAQLRQTNPEYWMTDEEKEERKKIKDEIKNADRETASKLTKDLQDFDKKILSGNLRNRIYNVYSKETREKLNDLEKAEPGYKSNIDAQRHALEKQLKQQSKEVNKNKLSVDTIGNYERQHQLEKPLAQSNPIHGGDRETDYVDQVQKRMDQTELSPLEKKVDTLEKLANTGTPVKMKNDKNLYVYNKKNKSFNDNTPTGLVNKELADTGKVSLASMQDNELQLVKSVYNKNNGKISEEDIFDYYRKNPETYKKHIIKFIDAQLNKNYKKELEKAKVYPKFDERSFIKSYHNRYLDPNNFSPKMKESTELNEVDVNYGVQSGLINSIPQQTITSLGGTLNEDNVNDKLNEKLFEDNKLRVDVGSTLLKIADVFKKDLDLPFEPVDIYLTGSSANYNYNENSDIDLHLVYDYENAGVNADLLEEYLKSAKKVFNDKYNITVKGIPVELGCENLNTPLVATGVYSLVNDSWVKEPEKINNIADPDEPCYNEIVLEIEDAIESKDSSIIGALWKKLARFRKESLATEGEFGPGNAVFKKLRNNQYLARLKDAYYNTVSKELSLESLEDIE